jgi:hypothetical protein
MMRLFFGKIKASADNEQIEGKYYETYSLGKLGELEEGDYTFIISGSNVHLWKAVKFSDMGEYVRMSFDVIQENLPITPLRLPALVFFKLSKSLIVLTLRQASKSFFPIQLLDQELSEAILTNRETYSSEANYRKILVYPDRHNLNPASNDLQLYFDDTGLKLMPTEFLENGLIAGFLDNLRFAGGGRRQKDKK